MLVHVQVSISCPSVDLLKSSRHIVDSIVNLLLISSTMAPPSPPSHGLHLLLGTESLPADWAGGVPAMSWVSM